MQFPNILSEQLTKIMQCLFMGHPGCMFKSELDPIYCEPTFFIKLVYLRIFEYHIGHTLNSLDSLILICSLGLFPRQGLPRRAIFSSSVRSSGFLASRIE